MELIKKNIHMDRVRCRATSQMTLEEDMNIPDSKPDVSTLIYEKGKVEIEEVKPTEDHVNVRGRLLFHILYQSRDEGAQLVCVEGKLPFEEQIYMEGVRSSDSVTVKWELEDLTIGIINSRKLSVQSVVTLKTVVDELYDEEVPVDIYHEEPLEYRKKAMELAQIAIQKNDIFRIREEVTLPQNYPNVFSILWDSVSLEEVEFKPLEEKLSIQGEIHIFVLYEGEGEEQPVRSFETVVPFSGVIECHGCREHMIPDIGFEIGHKELDVRPDFDGEERMLGLELVLDISMKLYEEETVDIISDIYGVTKEIETQAKDTVMKKLLMRIGGKSKAAGRLKVKSGENRILQLIHSEGMVQTDAMEIADEVITLQGTMQVQVLYVTGDDGTPYNCLKGSVPFSYSMEVPGISPKDTCQVRANLEQLQVNMLDSEELDVKAVLSFHTTVFQNVPETIISDICVRELNMAKLNELPGMVAYVVKPDDNLWNIGKKYYVPVAQIREVNGLASDELKAGEKLLIVKGS